jgi:hypothetical protein
MDRVDRDDFAHVLGQTMEFYGKTLEKSDFSFWYSAMGDRHVSTIKTALKEYVKIGKYAPRPASIMEIINNLTPQSRQAALPPPPPETSCPPETAKAWMWFIGRMCKGSKLDGLFSDKLDIDIETQEKYLHIVNHEAKATDNPESIPDEYKLAEVWA